MAKLVCAVFGIFWIVLNLGISVMTKWHTQISNITILKLQIDKFDNKQLNKNVEKLRQQQSFSNKQPLILDIRTTITTSDCTMLIEALSHIDVVVVGITTSDEALLDFANLSNLAVFDDISLPNTVITNNYNPPLVINKVVKQGQQIYAKHQDLVLLKTLKPDAEALADYSLKSYDIAYGKLFAGIADDKTASIFVKDFRSNLVCIAGIYKMFTQVPKSLYQKTVFIHLSNNHLVFNAR